MANLQRRQIDLALFARVLSIEYWKTMFLAMFSARPLPTCQARCGNNCKMHPYGMQKINDNAFYQKMHPYGMLI